ncbi:dienelactone hydrolase family protein [Paenibacillus nasutitermitis]|uniref:Dienelactone hydrolase domain-containing protein n=1 Tax=Paenibacillus nasutitermitis TaxID=1652958 RepID=A0A916YM11_9BACL|nr:dienelactone hydrolase family protein [Paenibacillus nasutitermitis]GGD52470.1 hypothetical protein GCM10010911_07530 [Paenibacillus nasutitermitis]
MEQELYKEDPAVGNGFREQQKNQFDHLIVRLRQEADGKRQSLFKLDTSSVAAYELETEPLREQLKRMVGWPLAMEHDSGLEINSPVVPDAKVSFVSEDQLGRIFRVEVEAGAGLTTYGLLFLPFGEGPHPLVIAQHGGGGTPELSSGLYGETNYNDMTRRVLKQGAAVFAPQLFLWNQGTYGPEFNRVQYDNQLKQVGSSIAAVEIHKIQRALDYLTARPDIDGSRVGMIGLSYGGFYTMFTSAVDTRIKAVYSSCFINNRFVVDWPDFTWFNAGSRFLDAEVCSLIAPRFLYLEVGRHDDLFLHKDAQPEIDKVAALYKLLNLEDRFASKAFDGGHELDPDNEGIERFCRYLSMC